MIRRIGFDLSRPGAALACMLAFGAGLEARAQDSSASASAETQAEPSKDSLDKLGLGLMLDVGAPDGVGVSAVVRPVRWLRVNGGVTTNTLSLGVRGGVSLIPLSTIVAPSINLDVGHYFDTNYNKLVDKLGGIPLQTTLPIDDVGFNYASASVGLEIGKPDRFSISLRVGLTHGSMTIEDAEKLLQDVTNDPDITAKPLSLRFTTPSIKLGFLLYLY